MMTVELAHRSFGGEENKSSLVLLHGLLGSSRNWQTAGRLMSEKYRVFALDLRNHGESPHEAEMSYPAMAGDLLAWLDSQNLKRVHLLGHSMGGKVAMHVASRFPERVISLTVVDIAPRAYEARWQREFEAMRKMPVASMSRRQEAEQWLEKDIRDWAFRKFLVTNLERDPENGFRWIVNLPALEAALPRLFMQVPGEGWQYSGKTLFVRGARSDFIKEQDAEMIKWFFPIARLVTIEDAGHNVHFDQPEVFSRLVLEHMDKAV